MMGYHTKYQHFRFIAVLIFLLVLSQPISGMELSNAVIKTNNATYPDLFAIKIADRSEVVLGEKVIVTITIENLGNQTAYNVTIINPTPNPWIFNITGYNRLSYTQIAPGEIRQFSYSLTANKISDINEETGKYIPYRIDGAVIEYYDSEVNPTKYTHITNNLKIVVTEVPEDFSLANFNAAITFLLILIILNIILALRLISPKLNRRSTQSN